jgi:hypothetical protein
MADEKEKPQAQQGENQGGTQPTNRPQADPDLSDHYKRDQNPKDLEKK